MSKGKKPIILNKATIDRIKKEAVDEVTPVAFQLTVYSFIASMLDEKITDSKVSSVITRAIRYMEHYNSDVLTLEEMQEINKKYGYEIEMG